MERYSLKMAVSQNEHRHPSRNRRHFLSFIGVASVAIAALSGCMDRTETRLAFPPVADIQVVAEPTYPIEALTDPAVESAWWNDVLLWGRDHHNKLSRVCKWAVDLKYEVPDGWCG